MFLDGRMASKILNDVLQKIGIDTNNQDGTAFKLKGQMSPLEIKCNIQTQIIIQLGRYFTGMA